MAKGSRVSIAILTLRQGTQRCTGLAQTGFKKVEWVVFKVKQAGPDKVVPHPIMWPKPMWETSKEGRNVIACRNGPRRQDSPDSPEVLGTR